MFPSWLLSLGLVGSVYSSPIKGSTILNEKDFFHTYGYWDMEQVPGFIEGDIIPPETRNAIINPAKRWPNGIVIYELDEAFSEDEREKLFRGSEDISSSTCIQFRQRDSEENYVFVQRGPEGADPRCSSHLGYQSNPRQKLYFAESCLQRHGTITHEMLHTLGLGHEHQRPDRDDFVTIRFDKIEPGLERNFNRLDETNWTTFGVPYDYGSVLHYPRTAFTKDGSDTIIPKVEGVEIGQRVKVSEKDLEKVMHMYCYN